MEERIEESLVAEEEERLEVEERLEEVVEFPGWKNPLRMWNALGNGMRGRYSLRRVHKLGNALRHALWRLDTFRGRNGLRKGRQGMRNPH